MSKLLDQLNDELEDFTVTITDTDGVTMQYEFLDIVLFENTEYAVVSLPDGDGYVDIFRIQYTDDGESYVRQTNEELLDKVFDIFRLKNEDEFDFD